MGRGMRVLVACEFSGAVRDAFTAAGHQAMSCDLEPGEGHGWHYQGDVRDLLKPGEIGSSGLRPILGHVLDAGKNRFLWTPEKKSQLS